MAPPVDQFLVVMLQVLMSCLRIYRPEGATPALSHHRGCRSALTSLLSLLVIRGRFSLESVNLPHRECRLVKPDLTSDSRQILPVHQSATAQQRVAS